METLIKTKSPRSNAHTHAADFVTLRFNQLILSIFRGREETPFRSPIIYTKEVVLWQK